MARRETAKLVDADLSSPTVSVSQMRGEPHRADGDGLADW